MTQSDRPPALSPRPEPSPQRRQLLFLLLALTFLRGLVYLAVMPPWQHYDEPTHFEYVHLIAERRQLPQPGDYDLEMRREIAASMQAANFWPNPLRIDFWSDQPPSIGVSELNHPPLYYGLLAVPQLLASYQDVDTQLYLGRFISVLIYVLIVGSAYGLVRDAFPQRRWLPVAVAAFVALLPPLTDLMSSVNNDVGAVASVSVLLWASVRLIRRGPSLRRVVAVFLLAGICVVTKSTASMAALIILLIVGIGLVPTPWRRWLWVGLVPLISLAAVSVFSWGGHAAHWNSNDPASATNREVTQTPHGQAAFALSTQDGSHNSVVFQELGLKDGQSLAGNIVTLGAWVKAGEESGGTAHLVLRDKIGLYAHGVNLTTDWQFYAFTATISAEAAGVSVYVQTPKSETSSQTVYVDGIVLVDGEMPLSQIPSFETRQGSNGTWGTRSFKNLVRNGSAEKVWPGLRSWIGEKRLYQKRVSTVFHSVLDWPRTVWIYVPVLSMLFETFWGKFGWNHLSIPPACFYPLGLFTIVGLAGSAIGLLRRLRSRAQVEAWQWHVWIMLGVICLVSWAVALLRIHPVQITINVIVPAARYALVAIIPTAIFLCLGWTEILPRRWLGRAAWLGLLALLLLDAVALLIVLLPRYYG